MVKKYINTVKGIFYVISSGRSSKDMFTGIFNLNLYKGGVLRKEIGINNLLKVRHLKINGFINIDDLYFMQYMDNLEVLDLSNIIYHRKKIHEGEKLKLRKNLLKRKKKLTTIHLPEFISYIPDNFFYDCKNLQKVVIPGSVKIIGCNAFSGSGINEILIPNSIERIDHGAFDNCKDLESVIVEDGKKLISWKGIQFYNCPSLKTVYIGRNFKEEDTLISHQGIDELRLGCLVNNINFDFDFVNKLICEMKTPPSVKGNLNKINYIDIKHNYDLFWIHPLWNKMLRKNNSKHAVGDLNTES